MATYWRPLHKSLNSVALPALFKTVGTTNSTNLQNN